MLDTRRGARVHWLTRYKVQAMAKLVLWLRTGGGSVSALLYLVVDRDACTTPRLERTASLTRLEQLSRRGGDDVEVKPRRGSLQALMPTRLQSLASSRAWNQLLERSPCLPAVTVEVRSKFPALTSGDATDCTSRRLSLLRVDRFQTQALGNSG